MWHVIIEFDKYNEVVFGRKREKENVLMSVTIHRSVIII